MHFFIGMAFRRAITAVSAFLRRGAAPAVSAPSGANVGAGLGKVFGGNDAAKQQAVADLAKAMKHLSSSPHMVANRADVSARLGSLGSTDLSTFSKEELEEIARLYFEGGGDLPKDPTEAVKFWNLAIEKGSIEAKYSRALCLKDGVGIAQDYVAAARDMKELADKDNLNIAHYALAKMYADGIGVEKDDKLAYHYFRKAALGGVAPALLNLAHAYAAGKGVEQDDKKALKYYQVLDERGDPSASFTLGLWHYQGRGGLSASPTESFHLQMKAAKAGHPLAMFNIGTAYLTGDGVTADKIEGARWLERAAVANIPHARFNLAKLRIDEGRLDDAENILKPLIPNVAIAVEMMSEIEQLCKQKS